MNIVFTCGHPAHFLNAYNAAKILRDRGHNVAFTSRSKDVLLDLMKDCGFPNFVLNPKPRTGSSKFSLAKEILIRFFNYLKVMVRFKPNIAIGSDFAHAQAGWLFRQPAIFNSEDDAAVLPYTNKYGYRFAKYVLAPDCCKANEWGNQIMYHGYQEMAYLHPRYFRPDRKVVEQHIDTDKPFFLLRFSGMKGHHDDGVRGINDEYAKRLIEMIKPHGNIYVSTERELPPEIAQHLLKIDPKDLHHFLYYAAMVIGDCHTMIAEAGVLGTPAIRFTDFVGRAGYMGELEDRYHLAYGVHPDNAEQLFTLVADLLAKGNLKPQWRQLRKQMLYEVADYTELVVWLLEEYPHSAHIMKKNPDYVKRFTPSQDEIDSLLNQEDTNWF